MSEELKYSAFGQRPRHVEDLSTGEGVFTLVERGVQRLYVGEETSSGLKIYSKATVTMLPPASLNIPEQMVPTISRIKILAEYVFKSYSEGHGYATQLWFIADSYAAQLGVPVFIEDTSRTGWTSSFMGKYHSDATYLGKNSHECDTWVYRPR